MARPAAINDAGHTIGEGHARAKLLDHDVTIVLRLLHDGLSYARIAQIMEVSKSCIQHIAQGRTRAQSICGYRHSR